MQVSDFLQMVRDLEKSIQEAGTNGNAQPPKILDFGLENTAYRVYMNKEAQNQVEKKTDFKKIIEIS
jgi:hypothetical protein